MWRSRARWVDASDPVTGRELGVTGSLRAPDGRDASRLVP